MPDLTGFSVLICLATNGYIIGLSVLTYVYHYEHSAYPRVRELKRVIDKYFNILMLTSWMITLSYVFGYFVDMSRFALSIVTILAYIAIAKCAGTPRRYRQMFDREIRSYNPLRKGDF